MKLPKLHPLLFFLIYFLIIVIYAVVYYLMPDAVNSSDFTIIKSFYFSVVTITTLGYGDILPKSNVAMIVVASEAIFGIVIIGLFLSSIWQSFIDRLEAQQEKSIKDRISQQNIQKLMSFYKYIHVVLSDYKLTLAELTTPIMKRENFF